MPVQIGVQPKSVDKSKHGKGARNKSSEKVKYDDQRKCYHCREAGRAKSQSKDKTEGPGRCRVETSDCNSRPSSIAADAPLADDHVTMFLETTMRSDAGSTAPTGSERARFTSTIPTCRTCLMMDTCAGGGICPRGSDQTAQRDTTVATTQFVTAPDDSAHGNVDDTHFESHKIQVQFSEADVGFSMLSAGKTSQKSKWLEGYQVMLPGTGGQTQDICEGLKCGKAGGKPLSVLVARIGSGKHGWSTVEFEVQSGKVSCQGNDRL